MGMGWMEPTGLAFGQPFHKLRNTHQMKFAEMKGFAGFGASYGAKMEPHRPSKTARS
jgi:hypothetical protein